MSDLVTPHRSIRYSKALGRLICELIVVSEVELGEMLAGHDDLPDESVVYG